MYIFNHKHFCPDCYEEWSCDLECQPVKELEKNGINFGFDSVCKSCEMLKESEGLTPEWFDRYNGIIK